MTDRTPTFSHSRIALAVYDRSYEHRQAMLAKAFTNEQVNVYIESDEQAILRVQHAFFLDTKDRNRIENCRLVYISYIRAMVKKYGSRRESV